MSKWIKDRVFKNGDDFVEWLRKAYPETIKKDIKEVHMHHTWKPNHSSGNNTLQLHKNMRNYHVNHNGWSDIAQHLSLGKNGEVVLGRYIGTSPASATGYNGNTGSHPFMFETIGNFDKGEDKLDGAQLKTVLAILHYFVDDMNKPLKFHNEMSSKTCPGSGISKTALLKEVHAYKRGKESGSVTTNKPQTGKSISTLVNETKKGLHGNGEARKKSLGSNYDAVMKVINGGATKQSNHEVAKGVIEGSYGNGSDRKKNVEKAGYKYSAVQAEVNKILNVKPAPTKKSNATIANEVIKGVWGSGDNRKVKLKRAGYNYSVIQNEVNRLLGASSRKSNNTIVKEVLEGKWGNNPSRGKKLNKAGYNAKEIQRLVNNRLR